MSDKSLDSSSAILIYIQFFLIIDLIIDKDG